MDDKLREVVCDDVSVDFCESVGKTDGEEEGLAEETWLRLSVGLGDSVTLGVPLGVHAAEAVWLGVTEDEGVKVRTNDVVWVEVAVLVGSCVKVADGDALSA